MKRFLTRLGKFMLPLIVVGLVMEFCLRQIPNDYQLKRAFLDEHSNEIEILSLGSSHGFYDINPAYFSRESFNAAHVSQTLNYDLRILERYQDRLNSVRTIIIPISYSSYYTKLENSIESWRVKNYAIYYHLKPSIRFKDYFEIFNNRFVTNLRRLYSYYFQKKSEITCSDAGFGIYKGEEEIDIEKSSIEAAKRHTISDDKFFEGNIAAVDEIIGIALAHNASVILFTPPAWNTYRMNLDSNQLRTTVTISQGLAEKYKNVRYWNFIADSAFLKSDFFDGDHLNAKGAKKLTIKLESLIDEGNAN